MRLVQLQKFFRHAMQQLLAMTQNMTIKLDATTAVDNWLWKTNKQNDSTDFQVCIQQQNHEFSSSILYFSNFNIRNICRVAIRELFAKSNKTSSHLSVAMNGPIWSSPFLRHPLAVTRSNSSRVQTLLIYTWEPNSLKNP